MTGRRLKSIALLSGLLGNAVIVLASSQVWFTVAVGSGHTVAVLGTSASPALSALGLSGLALGAALAIAGSVIRIILGAVEVAVAALVILSVLAILNDPAGASEQVISSATGLSGSESIRTVIDSITVSAWPALSIIAGIVVVISGIFVIVTFRRWPASSRKYQAVSDSPVSAPSPITDWDALSNGRDPT